MAFTYEEVAKLTKINEYRAVLRANKTFLRTKTTAMVVVLKYAKFDKATTLYVPVLKKAVAIELFKQFKKDPKIKKNQLVWGYIAHDAATDIITFEIVDGGAGPKKFLGKPSVFFESGFGAELTVKVSGKFKGEPLDNTEDPDNIYENDNPPVTNNDKPQNEPNPQIDPLGKKEIVPMSKERHDFILSEIAKYMDMIRSLYEKTTPDMTATFHQLVTNLPPFIGRIESQPAQGFSIDVPEINQFLPVAKKFLNNAYKQMEARGIKTPLSETKGDTEDPNNDNPIPNPTPEIDPFAKKELVPMDTDRHNYFISEIKKYLDLIRSLYEKTAPDITATFSKVLSELPSFVRIIESQHLQGFSIDVPEITKFLPVAKKFLNDANTQIEARRTKTPLNKK
jgi:hypothetical protein